MALLLEEGQGLLERNRIHVTRWDKKKKKKHNTKTKQAFAAV